MTKRYRQFPANMMDEFYVNGQANTNKILAVRKLPNVRFRSAPDQRMKISLGAEKQHKYPQKNRFRSRFFKLMFQFR